MSFLSAILFNWPAAISMQVLFIKENRPPLVFFPIHMLEEGKSEPVFDGLNDPFYAVDSRDHQVIQPNHALLKKWEAHYSVLKKIVPMYRMKER